MKIEFDTRQFSRALKEYHQATGKDMTEILNRSGRNVAYRAAQFTPAATAAKIRADLNHEPHLKYALTSLALKKKGIGTLKSPLFAREVERFVARRIASRAYLRSGWAPAIEALGGTYRGRMANNRHGWATKANILRWVTEIANTVPGIETVGVEPLKRAIDFVSEDMLNYANSLMVKRAREHSATS